MAYLNGIDVSRWQTNTPGLYGQSFAFARATYGTTRDLKYSMHVTNFKRAGIVTGAYHFGVGWTTPEAQVKAFLDTVKTNPADLLILDLERDSTKTMTHTQARRFIQLVQQTGRKIGLYHSRSGFPSLGQDYNWIAQWGSNPPTSITWKFWQWQGSPLDRNKFNGTLTDLKRLAGIPVATPPPAPAPIFTPTFVRVKPGSWWQYRVSGNRTAGYTITGRVSLRTENGWSGQAEALVKPVVWAGRPRKLAIIRTGAYANTWVNLDDTMVTQP